jgi:hypothetical protein
MLHIRVSGDCRPLARADKQASPIRSVVDNDLLTIPAAVLDRGDEVIE